MTRIRFRRTTLILGLIIPLSVGLSLAVAQDKADEKGKDKKDDVYEELVVTGSRGKPRSITESMVPIDVISVEDFVAQGDTDVGNLLRTLVPSYNVNAQPISDAATVVRPANLRGLAPDHTLVLLNGKRRHRAAVIYWLGNGVSDGAQGPDISAIPSIALRQVEVLRDGASAQYGSDAIAGVMNFMLKDDREGARVEIKNGSYFDEGDGDATTISANVGLPLGETGFFNVSFEWGETDATSRSVQRDDAALLIAAGNTHVADPAQVWGSPQIEDDLKIWANFGVDMANGTRFYGHANHVSKKVTGGFYFRNPNTRGAVYSADGGETLLIGDLLDAADGVLDGSAGCPIVTITNGLPDQAALAQVFNDPNCFSFQEIFPGGFTPQFGGELVDMSILAGIRGATDGGIAWDISASYGSNEVDFFISNTVNASLGPATPTLFDPGLYKQEDINFNVDLVYAIGENANLATGVEFRDEQFTIGIGQPESFSIGPLADQGFSAASNGFPGFSDLAAGSWSRSNYALYADLEIDLTDDFNLGIAARYEDFDDFGTTMNSKIAAHYKINDRASLRGSLSNGFRAPTPGQSNAFNVSTQFDLTIMDLVNNGTIPSTSEVAQLRGGKALKPETSLNYSLGAVFALGRVDVTLDYFNIRLSDRLAVTQNFALTPEEVESLLAQGVTSAGNLANFRFFTNDFATETSGFDLVMTYGAEIGGGNTDFSVIFNNTQTDVTDFNPDTLGATRITQIEGGLPETRGNFTIVHSVGSWRVMGRYSSFSGWSDTEDGVSYGGDSAVDLEAGYTWNKKASFVIGAQNAFNNYPELNPGAQSGVGNKYSQYSPLGFNGGFLYGRISYNF